MKGTRKEAMDAARRRIVSETEAWQWACQMNGFDGTLKDWIKLPKKEREEYERAAAGIPTD
jgi:hypothetical protein